MKNLIQALLKQPNGAIHFEPKIRKKLCNERVCLQTLTGNLQYFFKQLKDGSNFLLTHLEKLHFLYFFEIHAQLAACIVLLVQIYY